MTPDFRDLADKISWICQQQAFGQHRNFLLGGPSGNGKTTFFNALAAANLPSIGDRYNRVPIVKIDAQVNQKSSKALLSQMILGTGANYLVGDSEEDLINKIIGNFEKCGVVLLLVDEVEHMTEHSMRRRLLEVSNRTRGVSIICASCNPHKFTESDTEIEGRWRDYYELEPWITRKTNDLRPGISDLLGIIEMFLPFTERSQLDVMELTPKTRKKDAVIGPAQVILNCTRGILRDIMMLIYESSVRAINKNEPNLTTENLISTWDSICRAGKK
jgi:energy-coupling factor transporter ATP-binding protein EcfA2